MTTRRTITLLGASLLTLAAVALPACKCNDRNRANDEANYIAAHTSDSLSPLPRNVRTETDLERLALGRLVGRWVVSGWSNPKDAPRRDLSGTAVGSIEHTYFLDLDFSVVEQSSGETRTGTMLFGSEPDQGITMSAWFSTRTSQSRFLGAASHDGSVIVLDESIRSDASQQIRVVITFLSDFEWRAEFFDDADRCKTKVGSLTFTRAG
jgi:hypothetical protein